ncbi:MAG: hypothetical protein ACRC8A_05495 [Microcoleaceae cyanobacterium]
MPANQVTSIKLEKLKEENFSEPVPVEAYADRLMDDLFQDVERVLEGGTKLPDNSVPPEFIALKPIKVPQIVLPPLVLPKPKIKEDEATLRDAKAEDSSQTLIDRLLLGAAFTSLLVTLSLWLATRGGFGRLFAPTPVAQPAETALGAKAQADSKFANYIERSLSMIQQPQAGGPVALPMFPGPPPVNNLPTLPVPSTPLGSDTNTLIAAINRVADAVQEASNQTAALSNQVLRTLQQQVQQPQVKAPTPGGQTSGTSVAPTASAQPDKPATTPTSQTTTEARSGAESANADPAPDSAVIPSGSAAPSASSEAAPEVAANSSAPASSSPAETLHTLVGVLELGDRSAALFEVNGVARRIYVGESVAASGWTLVEVANQEAVIRRNGEVRTIFVGQQF